MMTKEELFEQAENVAALILDNRHEGQALMDLMGHHARELRCWGSFNATVKRHIASLRNEREREALQTEGREFILLGGPNQSNVTIREIGGHVADKRLAFTYGGVVVGVKQTKSAYGHVIQRGADGKALLDLYGEPLTEPARALAATQMKAADAHNAALDACALFQDTDEGLKAAALPAGFADRMVANWGHILPPLKGLATYPVWHGGELLFGEGYHEQTRLWLASYDVTIESFGSPQEAASYLRDEWLVDFPFASERDFATALMLLASIIMARTILAEAMGPPMFLITAPNAGTGKSLLASVLIAVVLGEFPASLGYPANEEEREKRVGAAIMEGWSVLLLDNLKSGSFIGNQDVTLTKLITDVIYTGRILGVTRTFRGPAGLPVVATGNNIITDGDMARRTLELRLEAREDANLATRRFKHVNLAKWTLANRGRILGAIQTILQGDAQGENIGGFPEWSQAVARPILSAVGIAPEAYFQPWKEAAEEDAKGVQMPGIYELLHAIAALRTDDKVQPIEGSWFTAGEIMKNLKECDSFHEILNRMPEGLRPNNAKSLSFLLKRNAGSVYDGDHGRFRMQAERQNLGDRTKREERPVFRVRRYSEQAPETPKPKYERLASVRRGVKSR